VADPSIDSAWNFPQVVAEYVLIQVRSASIGGDETASRILLGPGSTRSLMLPTSS
jgi:hypothetical protein